jgi:pyruvate,water dikinase
MSHKKHVAWFKEIGKEDIPLVGGKGANLGEMTQAKFPVPNGFVVTAEAYFDFIRENNLTTKINHLLQTVHYEDTHSLNQVSAHIEKEIMHGVISDELINTIYASYKQLSGPLSDALVAVRSSATAEDLPDASFAGQQETYLNVSGEANLLQSVKKGWASLFGPRAIYYRHEQKFDHFRVGIAMVVQKMVASEKSGVMFTIDPVTNDKSKIIIESILGLGELIVQGAVTPDHYEVDKSEEKILVKRPAYQDRYLTKVKTENKEIHLTQKDGSHQKISDKQILELAHLGKRLEHHYYFPQDIEWAIEKDTVYIVQTRPITTIAATDKKRAAASDKEPEHGEVILTGDSASPGLASGPVKVIQSAKEIGKVNPGDILVAPQTNPDYVPAMKKAKAIVTDAGGRTSHAAIVSRELGIPAVVGTKNATTKLKTGEIVSVSGTKGLVYKGGLVNYKEEDAVIEPDEQIKTVTKVYVNLAQPELAEKIAGRHVDGVGLLRAEFIMADIGTHPKKLIHDGKKKFFIEKLSEGLEKFCRPFYPRPVVYRASDFKTNEYRNLIGGKDFEPQEPNPMLGYRGAFRYISDPQVFELELEAIKHVRNKLNLKNLWMMIPFVRTVKELIAVKKIIAASGLYRSDSFKLWMMCEIPANVILLEQFIATGIDGISIGSNDLTMLLLGTDRDNSEVAKEFDEMNDAVLWALEHIITTGKKHGVTVSICGQAPSLYPKLVDDLVKWGVTSVSIAPDVIATVRKTIASSEKNIILKHNR